MNVLRRETMTLLFLLPEISWVPMSKLGTAWHQRQAYGRGNHGECISRGATVAPDYVTLSGVTFVLGVPGFNIITISHSLL